jgi:predicted aspartyl protease
MSKILRIYALLILLVLTAASSHPCNVSAADQAFEDSTKLPFDQANNLIVIPVTLNGRGPLRFVLDTGASHHVMKRELAQSLGLKVLGGGALDDGTGKTVSAELIEGAVNLRIGNLTLKEQFFVTPFPSSLPFDGFLGAALFQQFTVRIDFRQPLITFIRPNTFRYQGSGVILPLRFHKELPPQVKAKVGGLVGWFKLDTGYNGSLALFAEFIERNKLLAKYAPHDSSPGGQTLVGEVGNVPHAHIHQFKLGGVVLDDVETSFFLQKGGSNSAFSGAIGTALLSRFNVILDYHNRRMILEEENKSSRGSK